MINLVEAAKKVLEIFDLGILREEQQKRIEQLREVIAKEVEKKAAAWLVTTELQDGTCNTYAITGRYKDAKDVCDVGEPIPLYK